MNNKKKSEISHTSIRPLNVVYPGLKKLKTIQENEKDMNKEFQKNMRLRKVGSTDSILEYFGDDQADKFKEQAGKSVVFHEHIVNFSTKQYLLTFILHLLYYLLIGPLFTPIVIFKWKPGFLIKNLKLSIGCNQYKISQTIVWFGNVLAIYCFFHGSPAISILVLDKIIMSILIRASSIAGKYATFSKKQFREYLMKIIPEKEFVVELLLTSWLSQTPEIIDQEIDSAMKRNEIDDSIFKISFFSELSKEKLKKIEELNDGHDELDPAYISYKKNKLNRNYYDSKLIFEYLTREYNKKISIKKPIFITAIFAILWTLIPGFVNLYQGIAFHGSAYYEIIAFYFYSFNTTLMIIILCSTFRIALIDMDRKIFILKQLSQILSPKKLEEISSKKFLPTINLIDGFSTESWMTLRILATDYGKKFFYRHELFLPVMLLISLTSLFLSVATFYFGLDVSRDAKIEPNINFIYSIVCDLNFVVFIICFLTLLIRAAKINEQFDQHIKILLGNKDVFQNLKDFRYFYFKRTISQPKKSFYIQSDQILINNSTSFVHKKLVRHIEDFLGGDIEDQLLPYLENILAQYECLIEKLNNAKEHSMLKLLGFVVTKSTVNNIIFGLVSISITAYEILYN